MSNLDNPEMDYDDILAAKAAKHADPKYHLAYIRDKPNNLEIQEMRGYEPVTESKSDGKGGMTARKLVKVGDLVLAKLPIEVYNARKKGLAAKGTRKMRGLAQSARRSINQAAGRHGEGDMATGEIRSEVTK